MTKDVLISFASKGREDYRAGLCRLIDSAKEHWHGDYLMYSPDHDLDSYRGVTIHKGWPKYSLTHEEMPYQFKIALIQEALEMGYERIVWLDSSIVINKPLDPLFESGFNVFHNLGHPLWKYISDEALDLLGLRREDIMGVPQIWGGAILIDARRLGSRFLFEKILHASLTGPFKNGSSDYPGFIAHRHDQAVMSVLLWNACTMYPYGKIVCPPHDVTKEYGDDIYLICRPNP